MRTYDEIVAAFGGEKAVAEACGISVGAVGKWRGVILPRHWPTLMEARPGAVTWDELYALWSAARRR